MVFALRRTAMPRKVYKPEEIVAGLASEKWRVPFEQRGTR
jgi:hypothetical protein